VCARLQPSGPGQSGVGLRHYWPCSAGARVNLGLTLNAMATEAAWCVSDFDPQDLANTAWAFSTAGRAAPVLFDAIAAEVLRRVREFKAPSLANTAWAFDTAGHATPALVDAIAAEAARRVREFNPQDLIICSGEQLVAIEVDGPSPLPSVGKQEGQTSKEHKQDGGGYSGEGSRKKHKRGEGRDGDGGSFDSDS